jgi:hypothetical protein
MNMQIINDYVARSNRMTKPILNEISNNSKFKQLDKEATDAYNNLKMAIKQTASNQESRVEPAANDAYNNLKTVIKQSVLKPEGLEEFEEEEEEEEFEPEEEFEEEFASEQPNFGQVIFRKTVSGPKSSRRSHSSKKKRCRNGLHRGRRTHRCRKLLGKSYRKCKNGLTRNRKTHHCRKNKIAILKRCKPGYERHYTGKCIIKCHEGKTRKRKSSKQCIKKKLI